MLTHLTFTLHDELDSFSLLTDMLTDCNIHNRPTTPIAT